MRVALAVTLSLSMFGCGRAAPGVVSGPGDSDQPLVGAKAWTPAQGFVVHEWGTLTSVVASDGTLLPGLHHEEEDLPGFVADRMAQAKTTPSAVEVVPVDQKMETPVTYFYSAAQQEVVAKVDFPDGILTQWFPWVRAMSPPVYVWHGAPPVDAWLSASQSIPPSCASRFEGPFKGGSLDWGKFQVLGREDQPELAGPLGKTSWGFARNVASNTLAVGDQRERFLFYRGLGNFSLPLQATVAGNSARFVNPTGQGKVAAMFVMNVTAKSAGFTEVGALAGGDSTAVEIPAAALTLNEFVQALRARLKAVLVADGLYEDEAEAMVDTWNRSYFLTPGIRAIYLLPQAVTDAVIPLHISPPPRVLKRTMVIRLELLTPAYEAQLQRWLTELAQPALALPARVKFLGLGRFAEPHLTRAVGLTKDAEELAAGQALLTQIHRQQRWAPTSAE